MDPLTIIGTVVALCQTGDRIIHLCSKFKRYRGALSEAQALSAEIARLKFILNVRAEILQSQPPECHHGAAQRTITDCCMILSKLERALVDCVGVGAHEDSAECEPLGVRARLKWLVKKRDIDELRQQLRDAVVDLTHMLTLPAGEPAIATSLDTNEATALSVETFARSIDESSRTNAENESGSTLVLEETKVLEIFSQPHATIKGGDTTTTTLEVDIPNSCHGQHRVTRVTQIAGGLLGMVVLTGFESLQDGRDLDEETCREEPQMGGCSIAYYSPRWLAGGGGIALLMSYAPRTRVALSLPRISPPDSDLFVAIRNGNSNAIKDLLSAGHASVFDIAAPYGITPLSLAMMYGEEEIARLLINQGAPQLPTSTWLASDVLDYFAACSAIDSKLLPSLVHRDYIHFSTPRCRGSSWARFYRDLIELEMPNFTELHKALFNPTTNTLANIARSSRATIDSVDSCNRTALSWAVRIGNAEQATNLLLCGADPNLPDSNGVTPLHTAASQGNLACMSALIDSGADPNASDRFGATPLHYACMAGSVAAMHKLVENRAEPRRRNRYGECAVEYAVHARQLKPLEALVDWDVPLDGMDQWGYNPLLDAVFMNSQETIPSLLQWNPDASCHRMPDGKTILHVAARTSDLGTIEVLLRNAAFLDVDPQAKDSDGFTALEYLRQRADVSELLGTFCSLVLDIEKTRRPDEVSELNSDSSDSEVFLDAVE